MEDFEAAEEERGPRPLGVRVLRVAVAVLVIVSLLLYFVRPLRNVFNSETFEWLRPGRGSHPIPLAPQPENAPLLDV